ncbi:GntR family transcriptional regulator [Pararhodonellum marinum]|uniref:GntR family transcriptional regulator n=1 Tax=Pararhodonellum marinum TaxID=2755358 RepID=UPI00188FFEA0|nr:GntR family transcriptional regulator [Pararhodonellum marinum]
MIKNDELGLQAYRELKKMIVSGQLAPGEKIVQEKLAARMGISRTPLRVALQMLEAENLIEPKSKAGYQVKLMDDSEILEIFDCRIALEATAAGLLAKNIGGKDLEKLKGFFEPYLDKKTFSLATYKKDDSNFHHFIIAKCGNKFLEKLFQQGNLITYIERIGLIRPPEETLQEHLDIVHAILSRDPVQAESAMKLHLAKSKQIVEDKINNKQNLLATS